ncbi:MAG TPA: zinc ribbon domain-containing protein [Pirellulales bacterium]|jgi:hypothetical protein|nr:zinc ribbon domain-containing protein [Pirellulales bacterium]
MTDDEDDDWEAPEPDEFGDGEAEVVTCPSCGEEIIEEAQKCPYCGDYVVHSTSPLVGRPFWFCLLGVLGMAATVFGILRLW